jgi:hypothetical protein
MHVAGTPPPWKDAKKMGERGRKTKREFACSGARFLVTIEEGHKDFVSLEKSNKGKAV